MNGVELGDYISAMSTGSLKESVGSDGPVAIERAKEFVAECIARVNGVGQEQYLEHDEGGNPVQRFERMTEADLIEYVAEEVRDLLNYSAMLTILGGRKGNIQLQLHALDMASAAFLLDQKIHAMLETVTHGD